MSHWWFVVKTNAAVGAEQRPHGHGFVAVGALHGSVLLSLGVATKKVRSGPVSSVRGHPGNAGAPGASR